MNIDSSLGLIFNYLKKFMKTDTVLGQPIRIDQLILVPIISIIVGAGGGGEGKKADGKNNELAAGLGGGARITVDAVIVIKKDEASILPVSPQANWGKILELAQNVVNSCK